MNYRTPFFVFIVCFLIGLVGTTCIKHYICDHRPPEQRLVQVHLFYGLGNNMFQYATGLAYALDHNKKLYISGNSAHLENAFDIQLNKPKNQDVPVYTNLNADNLPYVGQPYFEPYNADSTLTQNDYIYLSGLFQNEKHFKKYRKEILQAFKFKDNMSQKNKELAKSIQNTNSVAMHIRRGDYTKKQAVQQVLSPHYYKQAVKYIGERVEHPHFYIFSDDIPWAKENIKLDYPHTFVDHNTGDFSYNDMRLMSMCQHNIIANSTFSWWGAWLNENPDKIVITPDIWLKEETEFIDYIVPKNWVRLSGKANIAMLYIATGRYIVFFDEYYKSMEEHFLPDDNKTYFVWTDSNRKFPKNVVKIKTPNLGWPKAALDRYKLFNSSWDKLKEFDYMYFTNANIVAVNPIGHEIIPTDEQGITATIHPGYYKTSDELPYDRNPKSTAYIPDEKPTNKTEYYFMGGFNGGTTKAFKDLIDTIERNTDTDEKNGVIALWHDESHLNRYLYDKTGFLILPPAYGYPENVVGPEAVRSEFKKTHKLLILNKASPKWGGHAYLRGETNKKIKK